MASAVDNFFSYGRYIPKPFESYTAVEVASKYAPEKVGGSVSTTLCPSIIKALNAVCACMEGSGKGAVGTIDHRHVAEYKSAVSEEAYHLVMYNSQDGSFLASVYQTDTKVKETYQMNRRNRDGAALLMAMFPEFNTDDEFKEKFGEYYVEYAAGFPDVDKAADIVGVLCDNVYRRIKDPACEAHVKTNVDMAGNIMRLTSTHLDSGQFKPRKLVAGEFTIFDTAKSSKTATRAKPIVALSDFVGKYNFHKRSFSMLEQMLIPKMPEWYCVPEETVRVCKHIQATTGKAAQMRNFLFRGPAGSGKTMAAKAIASALNLPYMKLTCSSDTEIYDFVGQYVPVSNSETNDTEGVNPEIEKLNAIGGITYENVAKLMKLPDLACLEYDPEGTYERLTGEVKETVSVEECIKVVFDKITQKIQELVSTSSDGGQKFSYVETDFINALKNGYLVEIQEPTLITRPGVMVGLNSLLEQGGTITLPTGQVIQRHPDAVVVITTNVSYEGCRNLNQSMVDRMNLVVDIPTPTPEVMIERVMSITGETDEYKISQMVDVVTKLAIHCRENHITDGCVGMRSLIDWVLSTEVTGDPYESALSTIISKATTDEMEQRDLIESVLEQTYMPKEAMAV